ncbi:MAG: DUF1343 domain-containing protein [Bacteroidota bacterium]
MKSAKYTKISLILLVTITCFLSFACEGSTEKNSSNDQRAPQGTNEGEVSEQAKRRVELKTGPEVLFEQHLDKLNGKTLAVVANHTSQFRNGTHLVDSLISKGIHVEKVFAPEHGFRGTADAGEAVESGKDAKTGLPIISLYGKNKKPSEKQMKGLDMVIFDIQDVGSRHYTYIGTMTYVMEACAEKGIPIMVLDRPNPNGWYVDGPVLKAGNNSFIGMHEIPIVHGMSIAEYAQMVNGENWLKDGLKVELEVVPCEGYVHSMRWEDTGLDWVPPSPNLGSEYSAYLYPAICWLEPTPISVGRGTHDAFTIVGAPWYKPARGSYNGLETEAYSFTPVSLPGKSKYPKFQDKACRGLKFTNRVSGKALMIAGIEIIKELYAQAPDKKAFFKKGFNKWPGSGKFQLQLENELSTEEIYASWGEDLRAFQEIRNKYLLYP